MDKINSFICENPNLSNNEIVSKLAEQGIYVTNSFIRVRRHRLRKKFGTNLENFEVTLLDKSCEKFGVSPEEVKSVWVKDKNISIHYTPKFAQHEAFESFLQKVKKYAPKYPKLTRNKVKEPHCFIHAPVDIHLGKYTNVEETGVVYNIHEAISRAIDGTDALLNKISSFEIDQIILVGGNDVIHVDNPRNTTTSGTYQDSGNLWWELVEVANSMYVKIIESLLTVSKVKVVWVPSNHDFTLGWCLGKILEAWFRNNNEVEFDCRIIHRKYVKYGKNLIGFSHGDGAKLQDYPILMATESPDWSSTKFRYFYLGHIHHRFKINWVSSKDFTGVNVQFLRSLSQPDRWHYTNGYISTPAVEGFIHHPEFGQVANFNHYF